MSDMEREKIEKMAAAYAKATSGTRCLSMGECDKCQIRHCDYRSRKAAFMAGYSHARSLEKAVNVSEN